MEDYAIRVSNVTKSYKMYKSNSDHLREALSPTRKAYHTEFFALNDISFDVQKGQILGIIGCNGSGKSTLLKIITGVLTSNSGAVETHGRISSLLELGAGFNSEYTGIENIYFNGTLMGFTKAMMDERMDSILSFADIGNHIYQPVKTYSSGMFARLAFSCAIHVDPDILIVDEILSVGDLRFQAKCFNKFKEFKEKGMTILYVGHDVSIVRSFCDKAMWLDSGNIIDSGDPMFITAKYTEYMYLKEMVDVNDYSGASAPQDGLLLEDAIAQDKPINRWGTADGLIKTAVILDENGNEAGHFSGNDTITVVIEFEHSDKIEYSKLSVAFSIKNCEGLDYIVGATDDKKMHFTKKDGIQKVEFTFKSYLSQGEYYLVAALEDRETTVPTYYDYIEGAQYFKIFNDITDFGLFNPPMDIEIK